MRLIDADALKKEIRFVAGLILKGEDLWAAGYATGLSAAAEEVENAPTIEAEPVKQGQWQEDGYYDNPFVCSYCGSEGCYIGYGGNKEYYPTNYCPHCGAKMDEEG